MGELVDVAGLEPASGPGLVDLDHQRGAAVHGDGQRLRATHATEARRQRGRPRQRSAEVLARRLGERLVCALHDALRGDVDP